MIRELLTKLTTVGNTTVGKKYMHRELLTKLTIVGKKYMNREWLTKLTTVGKKYCSCIENYSLQTY